MNESESSGSGWLPNAGNVTGSVILMPQWGQWALDQLAGLGVSVPANSRLARAVAICQDVVAGGPRFTKGDPASLRLIGEAQRTILEQYLIATAVASNRRRPPAVLRGMLRQMLRGKDVPSQDKTTKPRDAQFELFVATELALGGILAEMAEPDLRFDFMGERVGVAVKRVSSPPMLAQRLTQGAAQLRKHLPGFIAVNADSFMEGAELVADLAARQATFDDCVRAVDAHRIRLAADPAVRGIMVFGSGFHWTASDRPVVGITTFGRFTLIGDESQRPAAEAFFSAWQDERVRMVKFLLSP